MKRFAILPAIFFTAALPAHAQSVCALVCPQALLETKACSISVDQNTCSCTCNTVKLDPQEVPVGTKLQIELNGTRYDLTKLPPPAGSAQAFLDTLGDILTPEIANPKGEPGTVVLKDDGTIGGHYGSDGEFNPGKPANMK